MLGTPINEGHDAGLFQKKLFHGCRGAEAPD